MTSHQRRVRSTKTDKYRLSHSGQGDKTRAEMAVLYQAWLDQYPIVSIEDGLAETD